MQDKIITLNKHQLYDLGTMSDGEPTGQYSNATKYFYKPLAAAEGRDGKTDHITLKDTGDFYSSMKVRQEDDVFYIEADMVKEDSDLEARFPEALGLTDESKEEIINEIKPKILEAIRQEIAR